MQSIVAILAVLVGVAFANPMAISSDVDQKNKEISATEYLKKIFQDSVMHYNKIDQSSQDDIIDELVAKLPALGLHEASDIARRVDLKQMIRDSDLSSLTLCLPSDKAVQKWRQELPSELKPEALKQLVKAWIVPGVIRSSSISHNMMVKSLNGVKLRFNVYNNEQSSQQMQMTVTVNGARIIDADRITNIGLIHVVDKVIYPLPVGNVIQTLDNVKAFSGIVDLIKKAELSQDLAGRDPITVFVPTNKALETLPAGVLEDLKQNKAKLQDLLKYHVISDVKYSASLSSGERITAMQGDQISVTIENGKFLLNQKCDQSTSAASVIKADIPTTNGVIHVIDQVLVPEQKHYVLV